MPRTPNASRGSVAGPVAASRCALIVPESMPAVAFSRAFWYSQRTMKKTLSLLTLATLVLSAAPTLCQGADEKGFHPLFHAKDLTGWKLRHPDGRQSWTIEPGGVLKNT